MKNKAYIFVERNMGSGYAFAYPYLNPLYAWFLRKFILPVANQEMQRQERHLNNSGNLAAALSSGIAVYASKYKHTVYMRKISPDGKCQDPRAKGRNPRFEMYVVFHCSVNVFSKQFNEFQDRCNEIAWDTFVPGANENLTVELLSNMLYKK